MVAEPLHLPTQSRHGPRRGRAAAYSPPSTTPLRGEEAALRAGCDAFVAKPFDLDAVEAAIRSHLRTAPA